jgi:hypothetical protein
LQLLQPDSEIGFEKWFVDWVPSRFRAKKSATFGLRFDSMERSNCRFRKKPEFCFVSIYQALLLNYQTGKT